MLTLLMQEPSGTIFEIVKLILVFLGSTTFGTLLTAFFMRRKVSAETNKVDVDAVQVLTNTSIAMLDPLKQQINYLSTQLTSANSKVESLSSKVKGLEEKVHSYEMILKAGIVEVTDENINTVWDD